MVHEVIAYDTAVVEVTRMGGLILHTFRLGCLNEKEEEEEVTRIGGVILHTFLVGCLNEKEEEEAPLGIDYGY